MKIGIIVLDTLRYDTYKEEMGTVQSLADHEYDNMYSTSRWTPSAHASLFTGYYPTEVGVHAGNRHLSTPAPTLAERLNETGYKTIMLSNNVHLDPFFNFDRGFDLVHRGPELEGRPKDASGFDWDELSANVDDGWKMYIQAIRAVMNSDAPTVPALATGFRFFLSNLLASDSAESNTIDWAINVLANEDIPDDFFLFANLMPCHYPYNPPDEYTDCEPLNINPLELSVRNEPVSEEEHRRQWDSYKGAARYLDEKLPELINTVNWDVLFVLSDHGEMFGEYTGIRGHQYGMYPELVHVPALAIGDEIPAGVTSRPTSLVDVNPTILTKSGIRPDGDERGYDLLSPDYPDESYAYAESTGCFEYRRQLRDFENQIPEEWDTPHYMLASEENLLISDKDGNRMMDIESKQEKSVESEFREQVTEIRENRRDYTSESTQREVPDEIQSRLENLGYR